MSSVSTTPQITGPPAYAIGSPIGTTTTSAAEGITPADVIRILKQRKVSIIATAVVLYVLVGIATGLVYLYAPAYPSEAILELEIFQNAEFRIEPPNGVECGPWDDQAEAGMEQRCTARRPGAGASPGSDYMVNSALPQNRCARRR